MLDSVIKLVIGDLEEKKVYKQFMKRVRALPQDYRFAFQKIQHYMYCVGPYGGDMAIFTDMKVFTELVELFEASAADGKQVLDVIGSDVGKFTDEFMSAFATDTNTMREKLNKDIMERFHREGQ